MSLAKLQERETIGKETLVDKVFCAVVGERTIRNLGELHKEWNSLTTEY